MATDPLAELHAACAAADDALNESMAEANRVRAGADAKAHDILHQTLMENHRLCGEACNAAARAHAEARAKAEAAYQVALNPQPEA